MAVGAYIYVGKSRVRRKNKEKRRKRKEEGRRRSPTPPGGSPCSGRIRYSVLTSSSDDGDDLSYLGVGRDVEADCCSTGSSGSEDLLPLIDLDSALDLRPQSDKHLQRLKMPFDFFKRKEKKEKETKEEVPVNEELNDVKAKPEEEQKPTPEDNKMESIQESEVQEKPKEEPQKEEQLEEVELKEKQEDPKTDEKPVDEEPEEKVDTIAEALKETGEALKTQVEHINEIPNGKVQDEEDVKTGVLCCTIV